MKRNAIVYSKKDEQEGHFFYGRVWRLLEDGRLVVVCGGGHVKVYEPDELVLSDYKGTVRRGRFVPMDSLRQLKKWASYYNPHFGSYRHAWGGRWTKEETRRALDRVSQGLGFHKD